jgi:hypothetical protein
MQFLPVLLTLTALFTSSFAAPSHPSSDLMARQENFFPNKCDVYACGWCHYYYDDKPTPDGGPAYDCLKNDKWQTW